MKAGRPELPAGERKSERVVLSLTPHDVELLDALVKNDELSENRQEMLRQLLRVEHARRVNAGTMKRKRGSRK